MEHYNTVSWHTVERAAIFLFLLANKIEKKLSVFRDVVSCRVADCGGLSS